MSHSERPNKTYLSLVRCAGILDIDVECTFTDFVRRAKSKVYKGMCSDYFGQANLNNGKSRSSTFLITHIKLKPRYTRDYGRKKARLSVVVITEQAGGTTYTN